MDACNYSLRVHGADVTAAEIIDRLDAADPIHRARIGEIWRLCKTGMRYSNEDYDVLSAAYADLCKWGRAVAEHERSWCERWANVPGQIADATRWARSTVDALPRA